MAEYVRLRNMNDFDEWNSNEIEETNIDDEDDDLDDDDDLVDNLEWLSQRGQGERLGITVDHGNFSFNSYFEGREYDARNIGSFIRDVMDKLREYEDPRFRKFLMKRREFKIKKLYLLVE